MVEFSFACGHDRSVQKTDVILETGRFLIPTFSEEMTMSCVRMLLAAAFGCVLTVNSFAHDLKVMPEKGSYAQGDTANISISWGHKLPHDAPLDANALDRYELKAPSGTLIPLKASGLSQHAKDQSLQEEGVYQAIATRKPSIFTVVVDAEGKHRHHRGPKTSVKPEDGKIDYAALSHQYAKSLITSGKRDKQLVAAQGLPLEIVPLEAPADWRANRDLRFQVLFQGQPVTEEELVVSVIGIQPTADAQSDTDTDLGAFVNPTLLTDRQGVVTVKAGPAGTWVLRQRTKQPVAEEALRTQYDYESHTSTLVLEVLP